MTTKNRQIVLFTQSEKLVDYVQSLLEDMDLIILTAKTASEIYAFVEQGARLILLDNEIGLDVTTAICTNLSEGKKSHEVVAVAILHDVATPDTETIVASGASDVLDYSQLKWTLAARVRSQLKRIDLSKKLTYRTNDAQNLIEITSRLTRKDNLFENLYTMTALLAKELDVNRCSVVLVPSDGEIGLVIASSDDPEVSSLPIYLKSYPEIREVAQSNEPLIVTDVSRSRILEDVLSNLETAKVSSVALFPITREQGILGVIFLRYTTRRSSFDEREMVFCQTVANAVAIALRNNEMLASLRAKTEEVEQVQNEAKLQVEALQPYEDFFKGSVDGMAVLSELGEVVFINPVAANYFGSTADKIIGKQFTEFLAASDRSRFSQLLVESVVGNSKKIMDFSVGKAQTGLKVISVAAGPLGEKQMALLTMRDVTDERVMARRLADAQERLIESEKKSAMMEVAGAAAHELNQPLTSVMTSIALIRKLLKMDPNSSFRVLETMEQETERMASIIRRLGKLTEYTTKSYVGHARIIDLERATEEKE